VCYPAELGRSGSNSTSDPPENVIPHVPHFNFKVTRAYRNRHRSIRHLRGYDFQLKFRRYGPISYRFRDKRDFSRKSRFFPTYVYFARRGRTSWNWVKVRGQKKTGMLGLPGRQRSFTISTAVWDTIHQRDGGTDRQTNRRTDTGRQQIPYLRIIASWGNSLLIPPSKCLVGLKSIRHLAQRPEQVVRLWPCLLNMLFYFKLIDT